MDAPAGRCHVRSLCRARTASAVWGAGTADRGSAVGVARAGCTFDPKARPGTLALEGGAPRGDRRARRRNRLLRGNSARPIEAWRGGWSSAGAGGSECSSHRLYPPAALDRSAAVRELKRGQGAGVLLRWAHGGAAQLAGRDQRVAGRSTHLGVLI